MAAIRESLQVREHALEIPAPAGAFPAQIVESPPDLVMIAARRIGFQKSFQGDRVGRVLYPFKVDLRDLALG